MSFFRLFHQIADPLFGENKVRQSYGIQLPAQTGDVYRQGILINEAVGLPELGHQGVAG